MARVPSNRIATHPGALLLEQIEEMGLSVNGGLPLTPSIGRTKWAHRE